MRKIIYLSTIFLLLLLSVSCNSDDDTPKEEIVVVANRGAGSISFINAETNKIISTLSITGSEPMYVVYVPVKDRIYVGDRANDKIHIINPETKQVVGAVNVGKGVFHMWANGIGSQLWVSNDIDKTISVIDLDTNSVVQTIEVGIKPHDVFVTKDGSKAYVSVIQKEAATPDKIFMYSTSNYNKIGEVSVGKDPHLFHLHSENKLYVPCQSGQLYVLKGEDLSIISNTNFEGAHGIFSSPDEENLYITNLPGKKLYSINASNSTENGTAIPSLHKIPHNLVVNREGDKLFVTHSGANANQVSYYSISNGILTAESSLVTSTNPFGIAYYKRDR